MTLIKVTDQAKAIYSKFREHSTYVVTPGNIQAIIDLCNELKPKRVLDLGAGFGTSAYTFLSHSDAKVDMYEHTEFLRDKIRQNLTQFEGRYSIIDSYEKMPPEKNYDIIFIDGGAGKRDDGGSIKTIRNIINYLDDVRVLYFEGYRMLQRIQARKALRHRFLYTVDKYKEPQTGDKKTKGGTRISCRKSDNVPLRFINYIYWELREIKPVKYFFKYRYRKAKELLGIKG